MRKKLGLYIHIPFCERKCGYCGFLSFSGSSESDRRSYAEALCRELMTLGEKYSACYLADSIFIGGGTPSLLSSQDTENIVKTAKKAFRTASDTEITIEGNPDSLSAEKLSAYADCGINRLSIGTQSADDDMLRRLGRVHSWRDFLTAYERAADAGFRNVNVDIMFGFPGLDMETWENTLKEMTSLRPQHISFYSLQLEEGTPFYESYRNGSMDIADESLDRAMYHRAVSELKKNGYGHYEISNCSLPGFECRHNMKYWSMGEYLGAGLGASSYIRKSGCQGTRYKNTEDTDTYISLANSGMSPISAGSCHKDTISDSMAVYMFTGLRRRGGIDLDDFRSCFGSDLFKIYREKADIINGYTETGMLRIEDGRLFLTEDGIDVSNDIMSEFV